MRVQLVGVNRGSWFPLSWKEPIKSDQSLKWIKKRLFCQATLLYVFVCNSSAWSKIYVRISFVILDQTRLKARKVTVHITARSDNLCSIKCCMAEFSTDENINTCSLMMMSDDVSSFCICSIYVTPSLSRSLRLNYDVWQSQSAKAWHQSMQPMSPHAVNVLREQERDMQIS